MKNQFSKLSLIAILFSLMLSFYSCSDDNDDHNQDSSPLIGAWYLSSYETGAQATGKAEHRYFFYKNGVGCYQHYEDETVVHFTWLTHNNSYVNILYKNGETESLFYRFNNGCLHLSPNSDFSTFDGYVQGPYKYFIKQ